MCKSPAAVEGGGGFFASLFLLGRGFCLVTLPRTKRAVHRGGELEVGRGGSGGRAHHVGWLLGGIGGWGGGISQ